MMDKRLLDILCDPVSKTPLRLLSTGELDSLNRAISAGTLETVRGRKIEDRLDGGLITMDGKVVYRVQEGIPVVLPDEGIGTLQLSDFSR